MKTRDWRLQDIPAFQVHNPGGRLPFAMEANRISETDRGVLHRHLDFFALIVIRQGRGLHILDGVPYGLTRGDVYAMAPGETHLWSQFNGLTIDSCYFGPHFFDFAALGALRGTPGFLPLFGEDPLRRTRDGGRRLHLTPDRHTGIESEIAELRAAWVSETPLGGMLTRAIFLRLLAHLAQYCAEGRREEAPVKDGVAPHPTAAQAATVADAVRYLEEHFAEPISVEQVAASVFLSPSRFRHVFGGVMGRSPQDFLGHLRVERARSLLTTTDAAVTEIGLAVGFGSPAHFARTFRATVGLTPSEYRQSSRHWDW